MEGFTNLSEEPFGTAKAAAAALETVAAAAAAAAAAAIFLHSLTPFSTRNCFPQMSRWLIFPQARRSDDALTKRE